jgi:hypothetical protein
VLPHKLIIEEAMQILNKEMETKPVRGVSRAGVWCLRMGGAQASGALDCRRSQEQVYGEQGASSYVQEGKGFLAGASTP